jgi:hypothetical protein
MTSTLVGLAVEGWARSLLSLLMPKGGKTDVRFLSDHYLPKKGKKSAIAWAKASGHSRRIKRNAPP